MIADEELAEAFRAGDDRAFSTLYERYRRALYTFGLRMLGDPEAARDLVQEAFLRVYEKRRQLNHPGSFRGWLFTIGRNRCISHLRQNRSQAPLDTVPEEAFAIEISSAGMEAEEDVQLIRLALSRIKEEFREVLILREYQDLSYKEIAEITESTEGAVKSRLFKARRALHEILKPSLAGRR
jgi:RNA polymerase sigma-70 factor, ECF subfamily